MHRGIIAAAKIDLAIANTILFLIALTINKVRKYSSLIYYYHKNDTFMFPYQLHNQHSYETIIY